MTVYQPRTRTISFRLSEAEYSDLKSLSIAQGGRSLSDFVRDTVRRVLVGAGNGPSVQPVTNQTITPEDAECSVANV